MERKTAPLPEIPIMLAPTATKFAEKHRGAVVVSGSHGGLYPGYLAAKAGVRAVILNDAGIGLAHAGIACLSYLENLGIAAATVSHRSCRIGDAEDMMQRGTIGHANGVAAGVGVQPGQTCRAAAERLRVVVHREVRPEPLGEARTVLAFPGASRRIVLVDSAALVMPDDVGQIVVTGSHGALVGGAAAMALQVTAFAAVFNDAGIGVDEAGITRLPALDARGIAAFTVASATARIGEAVSTFRDGVISRTNVRAGQLGAKVGQRAEEVLREWL